MISFQSVCVEDTQAIAAALGGALQDGDFVSLTGDLGAGKTHFTQGVGTALGITEALTSPTFNIVFEYTDGRIPLYHFDLYRLEDALQLEDIDYYALIDASTPGAAMVEWADKFLDELPDERLDVAIVITGASSRDIRAQAHGQRAQRLLDEWVVAVAQGGDDA